MGRRLAGLAYATVGGLAVVLLVAYWAELKWVRYGLAAVIVLVLVRLGLRMRREAEKLDRASLGRCVRCGYDLEGIDPPGACPECGEPFGAT